MQINFFEEDSKFPSGLKKTMFRALVQTIVKNESKKKIDYINFIACSDEYLLNVNQQFLQHDYYTDVITFDYSENEIASDVVMSMDRIEDNAKQNKVSKLNECYRILIHGVLHLVGYKDKAPDDKTVMTQKEDFYLRLVK
ncbi:MAG: rRNA maturation RNase YbeY [Bacteroidales bacterium]|nr:rRNA maturation RNase YbeY [Bacteroidales bacterium]